MTRIFYHKTACLDYIWRCSELYKLAVLPKFVKYVGRYDHLWNLLSAVWLFVIFVKFVVFKKGGKVELLKIVGMSDFFDFQDKWKSHSSEKWSHFCCPWGKQYCSFSLLRCSKRLILRFFRHLFRLFFSFLHTDESPFSAIYGQVLGEITMRFRKYHAMI